MSIKTIGKPANGNGFAIIEMPLADLRRTPLYSTVELRLPSPQDDLTGVAS